MGFTSDQATGFLALYRNFLRTYVRYERLEEGEVKRSLGSQAVEAYQIFVKVTPIKIARGKYVNQDRKLLLDILGSEEDLKERFPSLEAKTEN